MLKEYLWVDNIHDGQREKMQGLGGSQRRLGTALWMAVSAIFLQISYSYIAIVVCREAPVSSVRTNRCGTPPPLAQRIRRTGLFERQTSWVNDLHQVHRIRCDCNQEIGNHGFVASYNIIRVYPANNNSPFGLLPFQSAYTTVVR